MAFTVDDKGQRVIPTVAIETSLIVQKIKGQPAGFRMSYDEIAELVGRTGFSSYLTSAKRILLRDYGLLLETVRGEGVRVATPDQFVDAGARDMSAARRAFGRAKKKFDATPYEKLSEPKKAEFNARTSVLGSLRLLSTPGSVAKVQNALKGQELLPAGKVLEIFK